MEKLLYNEAKIASSLVDGDLGFQISSTEKRIQACPEGRNFWVGLAPETLQTPYSEFFEIVERLNLPAGSTLVDVGAGYGRLGYVVGKYFPSIQFIGYEVVPQRVQEGQRVLRNFKYPNVQLVHADVASCEFKFSSAEAFFLYDFGCAKDVRKVLVDLGELSKNQKITVVGRGRLCRDLIEQENPWLSQVYPPQHFTNYSIYQTVRV